MRDLKRVKEYIDLGWDKEKAIEMVDEEMENEPTIQPVIEEKKESKEGVITLTADELAKVIQEQIQKNNVASSGAETKEEPSIEDSFKNLLG